MLSLLENCIYFGAFVHMAAAWPLRLEMVGLPGRASEVAELVRKRDTICIYDAVMFQLLLARRTAVTKRSFELVLCFSTFGLHGL